MTAVDSAMVYVVDDDESVCRSLASLLEEVAIAVSAFQSAEAFLRKVPADSRGCLLLDVRMPGMSGLQLQQVMRERGFALPTIVPTGHADVPMAVNAMSAGAMGFVEKPFNAQDLLDRVQACLAADVRQAAFNTVRREAADCLATLSDRELEVMREVVQGRPSKLIASSLGISENTIDVHRSNLLRKTGTRSVAELVRMWLLVHPLHAGTAGASPSTP